MPSPERSGGLYPKEREPVPYSRAARFAGEQPAGHAYAQVQEAIFVENWDLSVFRLQVDDIWHVAVVGTQPALYVEEHLAAILSTGESVSLPQDTLRLLHQRRAEAVEQGTWIERHFRPGKRLQP